MHAMVEKPYIIANWKMNLDGSAVERFMRMFPMTDPLVSQTCVVIAPSYVFIPLVRAAVPEKEIALAGQDVYWEDRGAFTGAIAARQLADVGCSYVIVGHSERRALFSETDEQVNQKVHAALARKLRPIICFGESHAEKEAGDTKRVIHDRIVTALQDVRSADARRVLLAYEPLWAISTSTDVTEPVADTPESAQVIHKLIRRTIADLYDAHVATEIRIIYGGSVDEKNVAGFAAMDDINGVLVGGASADPQSFFRVIQAYHSSRH